MFSSLFEIYNLQMAIIPMSNVRQHRNLLRGWPFSHIKRLDRAEQLHFTSRIWQSYYAALLQ